MADLGDISQTTRVLSTANAMEITPAVWPDLSRAIPPATEGGGGGDGGYVPSGAMTFT